jgi:uncharacterized protein YoxC
MKRFIPLLLAALLMPMTSSAQTASAKPAAKTGTKPAAKPVAPAAASAAAPKTPLLSRDELRACMKMVEENNVQATAINKSNSELAPERDELKKLGDELAQALQKHKDGMTVLTQERADLLKAGQDLQAKTKDMDQKEGQEAVAAYNARANAFTKKADEYNANGAALNAQVVAHRARVDVYNKKKDELIAHEDSYKSGTAAWKAACADRRYDEADELAIKQGK